MRIRLRNIALATTAAAVFLGLAASAQANPMVVAGWDFSQYQQTGLLSTTDPAAPADSLPANYSNLDPTFNAGAESADFGTHYYAGSGGFGSSDFTITGTGGEAWVPTSGSLNSNVAAPVQGAGDNPFDSLTVLAAEGQTYTELLSMVTQDSVSVVFQADLSSTSLVGQDWFLSFGGQGQGAATPSVSVEYSADGSSYSPVDIGGSSSVTFGPGDSRFATDPVATSGRQAFFRITAGDGALLDNVAIESSVVPEPGTALLLGSGLAGLAAVGRRRSA